MTTPIELVINGRDNTKGAFASAGSALSKIGSIAMGILASQVFTKLAKGVTDFATGIVTEAREAQLVQSGLNAVIESTGGVAGVTSEMVNKLASSLQYQSKYTDEAIVSGQTMMLQFTNIGKDIFPQATQAALDLATRTGKELPEAFALVGRALENPAEGIGRLNMQFKLFDKAELKAVEDMAASGDIMGAQGIILDELSKKVGGAAQSQVQAWDNVKKHTQDLQEQIGTALLPAIDKLGTVMSDLFARPEFQAAIEKLTVWLGENAPKAVDALMRGFDNLASSGEKINDFIRPFLPAIRSITATFERMMPTIREVAGNMKEDLGNTFQWISENILPFLVEQLETFAEWFEENQPLIEDFIEVVGEAFGWLLNEIQLFWEVAGPLLDSFVKIVLDMAKMVMQIATGDWKGAWATMKKIAQDANKAIEKAIKDFLDFIAKSMGSSMAQIKSQWSSNWEQLKQIVSQVISIIKQTVVNGFNSIKTSISTALTSAVTAVRTKFTEIKTAIQGKINEILSAVLTFGSNLKNRLSAAFEVAVSAIRAKLSSFVQVGRDMINSIITGLQNNINALRNYLSGIISNLVNSIIGRYTSPSSGGGGGGGGGRASGTLGWETVPPGYPNDTYPIRLTSGEQFAVIPSGSRNNFLQGGRSTNITNYYNAHIVNYSGGANPKNALKGLV